MGATTDYRVYETNDRSKIKSAFADACEQARYEDGHDYPGTIACFSGIGAWHDKQFATASAAKEYLIEQHSKWSDALAVSFFLPVEPTKRDKEKLERAKQSVRSWEARHHDAFVKIAAAFAARKSGTVGCSNCGSRVAREFLKGTNCPVCNASLLSETDTKRLEKIKERVKRAREALTEVSKPKASTNIGWVVGGWCPE